MVLVEFRIGQARNSIPISSYRYRTSHLSAALKISTFPFRQTNVHPISQCKDTTLQSNRNKKSNYFTVSSTIPYENLPLSGMSNSILSSFPSGGCVKAHLMPQNGDRTTIADSCQIGEPFFNRQVYAPSTYFS